MGHRLLAGRPVQRVLAAFFLFHAMFQPDIVVSFGSQGKELNSDFILDQPLEKGINYFSSWIKRQIRADFCFTHITLCICVIM